MKQTAVEWLVEQFEVSHSYINEIFKESIEQAKEMERGQIIDASIVGFDDGCAYMSNNTQMFKSAEDYYNQTYKLK